MVSAALPQVTQHYLFEARRKRSSQSVRNDHYHSVANPAAGEAPGERPVPPQVQKQLTEAYKPRVEED